jgi:hypothetical protein
VPYLTMGPYVAAGVVEEQHGVYTLTAKSFERLVCLADGCNHNPIPFAPGDGHP